MPCPLRSSSSRALLLSLIKIRSASASQIADLENAMALKVEELEAAALSNASSAEAVTLSSASAIASLEAEVSRGKESLSFKVIELKAETVALALDDARC